MVGLLMFHPYASARKRAIFIDLWLQKPYCPSQSHTKTCFVGDEKTRNPVRTLSPVSSRVPLDVQCSSVISEVWRGGASYVSPSCSFRMTTSPVSQPIARIFLVGCHWRTDTCRVLRMIDPVSDTGSPCWKICYYCHI